MMMKSASAEGTEVPVAQPRGSRLLLSLLFLFLLALGAMPIIGDRYVDSYRDDVRVLVEPARNLTTELHVSLALGTAALRNYLNTNDASFLTGYDAATARERDAYRKLGPLAEQLGPAVGNRYKQLRAAETRWHRRVSGLLQAHSGDPAAIRAALATEESYENTLSGVAGLDDALARVTTERRHRIDRAERIIRIVSLALAALAVCAALIALSLGRKLQHFANATEQSRRELERVLASRARLARSITHDLKNPLNAIMGNLQLLEQIENGLSAGHLERIRRAETSANSMLAMIDSLLELERAKSGKLQVQLAQVDLGRLVKDVVEDHRDAIEAAGLELRVVLPDQLEPIETDPQRVSRILGNLLSNAVKYTSIGSVRVGLATESNGAIRNGSWIGITVRDSGRGIPAADLEHIFEEFSRVQPGAVPGAGLGLAVSRRLARLLDGDITVESEVGKGSAFTLWLPQRHRAA
jgi:signal transduction histidine kinase